MQNLNVLYKRVCKNPRAFLVGFLSVLALTLTAATDANAMYVVSDIHQSAVVMDGTKPAPVLHSQLIDIDGKDGKNMKLTPGQIITINHGGETKVCKAKKESVESLLNRMNIDRSPLEMVSVSVSDKNVSITVASDLTVYERVDEPAPFQTIRRPNSKMKQGQERVVQQGVNGVRSAVYEVVWSNGKMISRQFVERLDSTAQNKIVEYGTAKPSKPASSRENIHSPISKVSKNADGSGTLTLSTGEVLEFSGVKNMKATAYTSGHDGVGTITATGTHVHRGTVAVDRRVIPLGTRMYIVTNDGSYVYGLSVAEDTGYVGNNLDLYHDTYQQCINFGRRGVTVYFLK